jgi:hypothetical protein
MDMNKLKSKLQQQRRVGVTRDGTLTSDPGNDGSSEGNATTLKPKAFYR